MRRSPCRREGYSRKKKQASRNGNVGRAIRAAKGIKTGNLSVNSSSSVHLESPFGGIGASGVGRELGMEAMNLYSETKTIFIAF